MSFRLNADQITTHYTRALSEFVGKLKYEDIPEEKIGRASCRERV